MYSEIEFIFKKHSFNEKVNRFTKYCFWISIITFFIIYLLFNINILAFFIMIILGIGIAYFMFFNRLFRKYLDKEENKLTFIRRLQLCVYKIDLSTRNAMIMYLKKRELYTKENLYFIIEHFRLQKPIQLESSFWSGFKDCFFAFISFIFLFYCKEENSFDFVLLVNSSLSVIFIILTVCFINFVVRNFIKAKSADFEQDLLEYLSDIYVYFDRDNSCKRKIFSLIEKIKKDIKTL